MPQEPDSISAGNGRREPPRSHATAATGGPEGWSREDAEQALLEHLPMIQKLIATIARQHRLSVDEAEEFSSTALLRLIDDDYAVLRKFREQCRLRTFLTVVLQRLCLDFRIAQWGKWRPAIRTRRLGEVAILAERLIMRDGLTLDEAFEVLRTNYQLSLERDTLVRIAAGFRHRGRPRFVVDDEISELPAATALPDRGLLETEERTRMIAATDALASALARLEPRDLLVLQLRYGNGMVVADIGRLLRVDYKWIFRRIGRLMRVLRADLESKGIRAQDIVPILGGALLAAIPVLRAAADEPNNVVRFHRVKRGRCADESAA